MEIHGQHHQHMESNDGQLPPGFRFHPTDEELITYYLLKKVLDGGFSARAIADIDLNKCEPWELPQKAKMGEKEWYFFSLRDRKYPTGLRTNRATEAGYWKATGKDREIYSTRSGSLVGMKKTLVFYKGRAPKGEKTNWVMHEYRLEGKFAYHFISRSSKDEWVVSRVFQKNGGGKKARASIAAATSALSFTDTTTISAASPSSSALPFLESPYAAGADRESCSYDSTDRNHVPCFSTAAGFAGHHLPPPPPSLPSIFRRGAVPAAGSAFPSLHSLQENLHLPFFLAPAAPAGQPAVGCDGGEQHGVAGWPLDLDRKMEVGRSLHLPVGATELDCLWSF